MNLQKPLIFVLLCFPGKLDLSYIDPVIIGRDVFNVTNKLMCGVVGHVQGVLSSILDATLDVVEGIYAINKDTSECCRYKLSSLIHSCLCFSGTIDISFMDPVVIGRNIFHATDDTVRGVVGYIQDVLCATLDTMLDIFRGPPSSWSHLCCLFTQRLY